MIERLIGATAIVHRLPEREMEMNAVFVGDSCVGKGGIHGGEIQVVKIHGLEIREAPPRLAKGRLYLNSLAVRTNSIRLPADGLEHMAVAKPNARLVGRMGEDVLVHSDRLVEIAEPR